MSAEPQASENHDPPPLQRNPASDSTVGLIATPPANDTTRRATLLTVSTVTSDQTAIANCRIAIRPKLARPSVRDREELTLTEQAPGVHVIECERTGAFDIVAKVPYVSSPVGVVVLTGQANQQTTVVVGHSEDLICGSVVDARGAPVAGAIVLPEVDATGPPAQAGWCVTDARGRFGFCRLAGNRDDTMSVSVVDGRANAGISDYPAPVPLAWGIRNHVLRTSPRDRVTVRLVDADNTSIAPFTVRAECRTIYGAVSVSASSDESGTAELSLPTGRAELLATPAASYSPVWGSVDVARNGSGIATLRMTPGATLSGRILGVRADIQDRDIQVTLEPVRHSPKRRFPTVHIQGQHDPLDLAYRVRVEERSFEVTCSAGVENDRRVVAPHHLPFTQRIRIGPDPKKQIDIALQRPITLQLPVKPRKAITWLNTFAAQSQERGTNQPGTFLLVRRVPGSRNQQLAARLDPNGMVRFEGVCPGRWLLRLRTTHRSELLRELDVTSGAGPVELEAVDLSHLEPAHVSGTCLTPPGLLATSVNVRAIGGGVFDVPIGDQGTFAFDVPAGSYLIGANVVGDDTESELFWNATPFELVPGATTHAVLAVALRRLRLRAVNAATGRGVAGVQFSIDAERATLRYQQWQTDQDGCAELFPCPHGQFPLSMWDKRRNEWRKVAVVRPDTESPLVIRIDE